MWKDVSDRKAARTRKMTVNSRMAMNENHQWIPGSRSNEKIKQPAAKRISFHPLAPIVSIPRANEEIWCLKERISKWTEVDAGLTGEIEWNEDRLTCNIARIISLIVPGHLPFGMQYGFKRWLLHTGVPCEGQIDIIPLTWYEKERSTGTSNYFLI